MESKTSSYRSSWSSWLRDKRKIRGRSLKPGLGACQVQISCSTQYKRGTIITMELIATKEVEQALLEGEKQEWAVLAAIETLKIWEKVRKRFPVKTCNNPKNETSCCTRRQCLIKSSKLITTSHLLRSYRNWRMQARLESMLTFKRYTI